MAFCATHTTSDLNEKKLLSILVNYYAPNTAIILGNWLKTVVSK